MASTCSPGRCPKTSTSPRRRERQSLSLSLFIRPGLMTTTIQSWSATSKHPTAPRAAWPPAWPPALGLGAVAVSSGLWPLRPPTCLPSHAAQPGPARWGLQAHTHWPAQPQGDMLQRGGSSTSTHERALRASEQASPALYYEAVVTSARSTSFPVFPGSSPSSQPSTPRATPRPATPGQAQPGGRGRATGPVHAQHAPPRDNALGFRQNDASRGVSPSTCIV